MVRLYGIIRDILFYLYFRTVLLTLSHGEFEVTVTIFFPKYFLQVVALQQIAAFGPKNVDRKSLSMPTTSYPARYRDASDPIRTAEPVIKAREIVISVLLFTADGQLQLSRPILSISRSQAILSRRCAKKTYICLISQLPRRLVGRVAPKKEAMRKAA
jgi:hypothetical protein